MKNTVFTLLLLGIALVTRAEGTADRERWEGKPLNEVLTLGAVPRDIRVLLRVEEPGVEGVADRGAAFNETDRADPRLPMRRFIVAGIGKNVSLVALEHGGFFYRVEVFLFSDVNGTNATKQEWVLTVPYVPTTLEQVIEAIPSAAREK